MAFIVPGILFVPFCAVVFLFVSMPVERLALLCGVDRELAPGLAIIAAVAALFWYWSVYRPRAIKEYIARYGEDPDEAI